MNPDSTSAPPPVSAWESRIPNAAAWVCVMSLVAWTVYKVWPGLFIPWWFNTDELVFYYEVIRQLRLDLTQTFFDIPGTPYMTLTSVLVLPWWLVERMVGASSAVNPSDFAFEHVQGVYTLMRAITLTGYAAAIGLTYAVFRRVSGVITAVAAAILTATLPIHVHYSHFVRTESLGLVLCLIAILLMLHPRTSGKWHTYLAAGLLAGAAMGARFHFALVGLPVLLAIYLFHDRSRLDPNNSDLPHRAFWSAGAILAGIFVIGAVVTILFRIGIFKPGLVTQTMLLTTAAGPEQYAGAKASVAKLWLLLGGASIATLAVLSFPAGRRKMLPVVNTLTIALLVGFAVGFLLSHPTFLWRGEHQLRSLQFYSDWVDPKLEALGPLGSWWNVTSYYFTTALPERWLQILFLVGASLILIQRQPLALACLVGAAICFFAHPVTMKLWPHHIIPWLPFLCFVAAYPAGWLIALATRRLRSPLVATVVLLAVVGALGATVRPRTAKAGEYVAISKARTEQIEEMNEWLKANVPRDAFVALSYFSLNGDGFLKSIEGVGVAVPQHVKQFPNLEIWWLYRSTLDGREGYVCVTRADILFFRDDAERKNPGSTYNPFEDSRFQELATFGGDVYELKVFKFDLRAP